MPAPRPDVSGVAEEQVDVMLARAEGAGRRSYVVQVTLLYAGRPARPATPRAQFVSPEP